MNGVTGRVYVTRATAPNEVDILGAGATVTVPNVTTGPGSNFQPTSVTLTGTVNPDGVETTDCHFEWSVNESFSNSTPCSEGDNLTGAVDQQASATPAGLTQGLTYNYRFVVGNANGTVIGRQKTFVPSSVPGLGKQWASDVHSDSVLLHSEITPGGAPTSYSFEFGSEDCSISTCANSSAGQAGAALTSSSQSEELVGLEPGTTYHYRVVGTNQSGTTYGGDHTFTTFPSTGVLKDPCPNAHVRQQVGAALLPDCRATARFGSGYWRLQRRVGLRQRAKPVRRLSECGGRAYMESTAAQFPARGIRRIMRGRSVPGGPRADGWNTTYVGLPADNPYPPAPFSSSLDEANAFLTTFSFGGPGICSPCFEDGSTGLPLREQDGASCRGWPGSSDPGPTAKTDGLVKQRFSADGSHLIFGSTSKFADGGNDETGDVSIYDRNLSSGVTQVVSTNPSGGLLECLQGAGQCHSPGNGAGIAELAVSSDGSRVLVGQLVGLDSKGNRYFRLYMHIGTSPDSIDLTPGSTNGVQFDGMTEDGTNVYFTTRDPLTTSSDQDTDSSADIFRSTWAARAPRSAGCRAGKAERGIPIPANRPKTGMLRKGARTAAHWRSPAVPAWPKKTAASTSSLRSG